MLDMFQYLAIYYPLDYGDGVQGGVEAGCARPDWPWRREDEIPAEARGRQ